MEAWAIIVVLIFSNLFTFGSTYFVTSVQLRHSDKQLEKEHGRAREVDLRERRREVRGEPLLRLRSELARMSGKMEVFAIYASAGAADRKSNTTRRIVASELAREYFDYAKSADWLQAVFMIDDLDIMKAVEEVERDYFECINVRIQPEEVNQEQLAEVGRVFERNRIRIAKIQSAISKKLEEL